MPEFVGQSVHVLLVDIRRVTHDEFVASALERGEEIRLQRVHATFEAVAFDVDTGDIERVFGHVNRVDICVRKCLGDRNGDTATAGAEVDGPLHVVGDKPGLESIGDELGKR